MSEAIFRFSVRDVWNLFLNLSEATTSYVHADDLAPPKIIPATTKPGKKANQSWKQEAEKLIEKLQGLGKSVKDKKPLPPIALPRQPSESTSEPEQKNTATRNEKRQKDRKSQMIALLKSIEATANKVSVDNCLWDLWLATGKAPPLVEEEEPLADYINRCVGLYQDFIKKNKDLTNQQIVWKGLEKCGPLMKTPLWYSALQYFQRKTISLHHCSFWQIHRNPPFYIFASALSEQSYKELSESYVNLFSKAKLYMKWQEDWQYYSVHADAFVNSKLMTREEMRMSFRREKELDKAYKRFFEVFKKLHHPPYGTLFSERKPKRQETSSRQDKS